MLLAQVTTRGMIPVMITPTVVIINSTDIIPLTDGLSESSRSTEHIIIQKTCSWAR